MTKKLMAIFVSLMMVCTFMCAASVMAEETQGEIVYCSEMANTGNPADDSAICVANCYDSATATYGNVWNAYLKFDISSYAAPINSVKFNVTLYKFSAYDTFLNVYAITDEWDKDSITAANAPAHSESDLIDSVKIAGTDGTVLEFDATDYVNELLKSGKKVASFVLTRSQTKLDKMARFYKSGTNAPRLVINDEVIYSVSGEENVEVELSDYALVGSSDPETQLGPTSNASSIKYYSIYCYGSDSYFGVSRAMYLKYNLESIKAKIRSAKLVYFFSSQRESSVYVHPVENDLWTGTTVTWNNTFGTEEKPFAPETTAIINGTNLNTSGKSNFTKHTLDVSEYVKNQQNKDGIVSLAVLMKQNSGSDQRELNISFDTRYYDYKDSTVAVKTPYLLIETEETGVYFAAPTFKIDGADSEVLKSGAVSANVKITNNMFLDTKATAIMIVYEGDRLSQINYQPVFLPGAATNGGVTSVTLNAGNITVSDKTAIKVLVWENVRGLMPVSGGFTFTSQGLQ